MFHKRDVIQIACGLAALLTAALLLLQHFHSGRASAELVLAGAGAGALGLSLLACGLWGPLRAMRNARAIGKDVIEQEVDAKMRAGLERGVRGVGKAVYERPWYLVVGESASGKTTAIKHAGLTWERDKEGNEVGKPPDRVEGTHHLEWCFPSNAVLIDTAGALMMSGDNRWAAFLDKLRRYRRPYPINGVVLAIAADRLLNSTAEENAAYAERIERQLTVVRKKLGVRFPVYVMITKCDLIRGFSEFFASFRDARAQHQILGFSSGEDPTEREEPFQSEQIDRYLNQLATTLRRRRTGLIGEPDPYPVVSESKRRLDQLDAMYAFPDNLLKISDNLRLYLERIFPRGISDTRPFFRGLYLTSALQTGRIRDGELAEYFPSEDGRVPEVVQPVAERSLFVRDLFVEKVLREGGLVVTATKDAPTHLRRRQRLVVGGSLAAAAVILLGTIAGWLRINSAAQEHREFWRGLAQKAGTDNWKASNPDEWNRVVADNERLRTRSLLSWSFRTFRVGMDNLDKIRDEAHAKVIEHGVVRPAIQGAAESLSRRMEWNAESAAALGALLRSKAQRPNNEDFGRLSREANLTVSAPPAPPEHIAGWPPPSLVGRRFPEEQAQTASRNLVNFFHTRIPEYYEKLKNAADAVRQYESLKDGVAEQCPKFERLEDASAFLRSWISQVEALGKQAQAAGESVRIVSPSGWLADGWEHAQRQRSVAEEQLHDLARADHDLEKEVDAAVAQLNEECKDKSGGSWPTSDTFEKLDEEFVGNRSEAVKAAASVSARQGAAIETPKFAALTEVEEYEKTKETVSELLELMEQTAQSSEIPKKLRSIDEIKDEGQVCRDVVALARDTAVAMVITSGLNRCDETWQKAMLDTDSTDLLPALPLVEWPDPSDQRKFAPVRWGKLLEWWNGTREACERVKGNRFQSKIDDSLKKAAEAANGFEEERQAFCRKEVLARVQSPDVIEWQRLSDQCAKVTNWEAVNAAIATLLPWIKSVASGGSDLSALLSLSEERLYEDTFKTHCERVWPLFAAASADRASARKKVIEDLASDRLKAEAMEELLKKPKDDDLARAYWRGLLTRFRNSLAAEADGARAAFDQEELRKRFPLPGGRENKSLDKGLKADELNEIRSRLDRWFLLNQSADLTKYTSLVPILFGASPKAEFVEEFGQIQQLLHLIYPEGQTLGRVKLKLPKGEQQDRKARESQAWFVRPAAKTAGLQEFVSIDGSDEVPLADYPVNADVIRIDLYNGSGKLDAYAELPKRDWVLLRELRDDDQVDGAQGRRFLVNLSVRFAQDAGPRNANEICAILEFEQPVPGYLWKQSPKKNSTPTTGPARAPAGAGVTSPARDR